MDFKSKVNSRNNIYLIEGHLSPVQFKFLSNSMPKSDMQKQIPCYNNRKPETVSAMRIKIKSTMKLAN